MGRPKGALNKRTRAALSAAAAGKLGDGAEKTIEYLLGIANDPKADPQLRLQAANAVLPYCKPRLASIEQTTIDERDKVDPSELASRLASMFNEKPELLEQIFVLAAPETRARVLERFGDKPAARSLH